MTKIEREKKECEMCGAPLHKNAIFLSDNWSFICEVCYEYDKETGRKRDAQDVRHRQPETAAV